MLMDQHRGHTHIDAGALGYLVGLFDIKSMLDVGCGVGRQVDIARTMGLNPADGVDGDPAVNERRPPCDLIIWNFEQGPFSYIHYDLIWCVELAEHIEEQYLPHLLETLTHCDILLITAAPPGVDSPFHVNCQPPAYWIEKLDGVGFDFDEHETERVRAASTMHREMVRERGMVFIRRRKGRG